MLQLTEAVNEKIKVKRARSFKNEERGNLPSEMGLIKRKGKFVYDNYGVKDTLYTCVVQQLLLMQRDRGASPI
jgi:hypothetical protein